jgi:hypothetical protein
MPFKSLAVVCASAAVAVGVAACGGSDDDASAPVKHSAQPVDVLQQLSGPGTAVALNRDFMTSLTTFGIKTTAVGGGTLSAADPDDQVATFPITSGTLRYYTPGTVRNAVQGSIHHSGSGLSLAKGKTVVDLTNFVIDPRTSVVSGTLTVDGRVAGLSEPLFTLNAAKLHPLQVDTATRTASFPATPLKLDATAARTLNRTFHTTGFSPGWLVGRATITVNT